ncbi:hypothetical protein SPRG_19079 [Saprolegnia parasitica CBS 223.65]|uniref:Uncharacterized protein n=1 Tax=Saprolegnia parasitica (strain CBS 223.65) TaxID=695850 RepID=A0A067CU89_SAPPC|nr:hypothetical protein SPRG_19079 [Saprolegnia parasitica CBS 223.65]KDO34244.1 hypothetical protein SPRG_19079 [Saprolegnia parasitica CBS 223.65]|eukprot:XP_012195275.1 hypothetical protein SPRG_19079 [Saprolegnia parasitica CBS 223.65]
MVHRRAPADARPAGRPRDGPLKARFVLSSNDGAHLLLDAAEKDLAEQKMSIRHKLSNLEMFLNAKDGDSDDDETLDVDAKAAARRPAEPAYERLSNMDTPRRRRQRVRSMILTKSRRPKVPVPGPKSYEELERLMQTLDTTLADKYDDVRAKHDVFQIAINHLSDENIARQRKLIKFNLLQEEIDRMQYHVSRAATLHVQYDEERLPRTAVYRHASRLADYQSHGVRIYNLAPTPVEATDRVLVPRQFAPMPHTPHNATKSTVARRSRDDSDGDESWAFLANSTNATALDDRPTNDSRRSTHQLA